MKFKSIILLIFIIILPDLLRAEDGISVRIAILPFEVFSIEKKPDLGYKAAKKLAMLLAVSPGIFTCDFKRVQLIIKEDENEFRGHDRLKEIARLLDANFVMFGSITQIRDEVSIDVQVFNNFLAEEDFKAFAEGTEIDDLLERIAGKAERDILEKAELIPPSQRPVVKVMHEIIIGEDTEDGIDRSDDYDEEIDELLESEDEIMFAPDDKTGVLEQSPETAEKQLKDEPFLDYYDQEKKAAVLTKDVRKPGNKRPERKKKQGNMSFNSDQPININSDSMEYDNKRNEAVFKGNVVARQGNVVMYADNMKVQYEDKGGLKQLLATGNVKIIQGDKIATGQKIVFYNDRQKIVATGNPRMWQGDNVVQGKKITVLLQEDRTIVEGGAEGRASATIYPKKKKSKKD